MRTGEIRLLKFEDVMNVDHPKLKYINIIVDNKTDRNILDSLWQNKICKWANKGRKKW